MRAENIIQASRGEYDISTDRNRLDINAIHTFLAQTYWSPGLAREVVERSIENSMPFGVYLGREQVGFARVITDRASFAYLADVYVLEEHRGKGLAKWLMEFILAHPDLQGLRRVALLTRYAAELYRGVGFTEGPGPLVYMERRP